MNQSQDPNRPTPERLMQMAWGYTSTLIVDAALHFRLFDLLHQAPKTAAELASATGASERGIRSLLH